MALRRNRVSAFVGSVRGRRWSERQNATISSRVTSINGLTHVPVTGAMPLIPWMPLPVTSPIRTVSAWSSSVCPIAVRATPVSRVTSAIAKCRCSRAHASTDSPLRGDDVAARRWNGREWRAARRATYAASPAESFRRR